MILHRRSAVLHAAAVLAAVTSTLVAGCGSGGSGGSGGGDKPQVLAALYPLEFIAKQIAGPDADVVNLIKPGVEPHDFDLTPRQVGALGEASLVLYLKGLQPAVDKAIVDNKPKETLDAAAVAGAVTRDRHGDEHETAKPGETPKPGEADEHGHEEGGVDTHVWLDPTKFAKVATSLGDKLAAVDPTHAAGYRSRAAQLTERLRKLHTDYTTGLQTCDRRVIVTNHAAFGYLAERYKLEQVGITGLRPDAEPSPARLAEVQRVVRTEKVTTIFFETLVSPKVAQTLAEDLKVSAAPLDPVESIGGSGADYFSLMQANLTALRKALSCR